MQAVTSYDTTAMEKCRTVMHKSLMVVLLPSWRLLRGAGRGLGLACVRCNTSALAVNPLITPGHRVSQVENKRQFSSTTALRMEQKRAADEARLTSMKACTNVNKDACNNAADTIVNKVTAGSIECLLVINNRKLCGHNINEQMNTRL